MTPLPRLAVTAGEPAGIGPDLVIQLAQQDWPAQLVVIADPTLLEIRAKQLGLSVTLKPYHATQVPTPQAKGTLSIYPVQMEHLAQPSVLDEANGAYVLETLKIACRGSLSGEFDALVTGPIHKGLLNRAGLSFSGHTEFFAQHSNTQDVVMMLATKGLRVALATTHIPLAHVSKAITPQRIHSVIRVLYHDLKDKFGVIQPRIFVCGLNPHAGEEGHLGREEIDIIEPTLNALRQDGYSHLIGPLPADTLFQRKYLDNADAVLAMYHDQGLPVLKYKGFGQSVNITLGLPFIRTSVDHGTALELAGKPNKTNVGSFRTAIFEALSMLKRQKQ